MLKIIFPSNQGVGYINGHSCYLERYEMDSAMSLNRGMTHEITLRILVDVLNNEGLGDILYGVSNGAFPAKLLNSIGHPSK